jgi:uncharacterized protein (TIGR02145 family)
MYNMDNMFSSQSSKKDKISYGKVKDVEGNEYKTVKIGKQWWMAENLIVTKYNDGTPITHITTDNYQWGSNTTGAYCWYDNKPDIYKDYGILYNWYAVNTSKLCPKGWHVSSDLDWHTLVLMFDAEAKLGDEVRGIESTFAGDNLKEDGTAHWLIPNTGNNESGFTALPSEFRTAGGEFVIAGDGGVFGVSGCWWSPSYDGNPINDWERTLYHGVGHIHRNYDYKTNGFCVRCVKGN